MKKLILLLTIFLLVLGACEKEEDSISYITNGKGYFKYHNEYSTLQYYYSFEPTEPVPFALTENNELIIYHVSGTEVIDLNLPRKILTFSSSSESDMEFFRKIK